MAIKDKKVLLSWGSGRKRTIAGLRSPWRGGPKIVPYVNTFYQTRPEERTRPEDLVFSPKDYDANSPSEARDLAWEDARNHKHFYESLIKKGYYPKGTRAKIKKRKNSASFIIELVVPKVKTLRSHLRRIADNLSSDEYRDYKEAPKHIGYNIQEEAQKWGYRYHDPKFPNAAIAHEDVFAERNYGVDSHGNLKYIDRHILNKKLPFPKRKKSQLERTLETTSKYMREDEEHRAPRILIVFSLLFSFILGAALLYPKITGNTTYGPYSSNFSILMISFLIIVFVCAYFLLRVIFRRQTKYLALQKIK